MTHFLRRTRAHRANPRLAATRNSVYAPSRAPALLPISSRVCRNLASPFLACCFCWNSQHQAPPRRCDNSFLAHNNKLSVNGYLRRERFCFAIKALRFVMEESISYLALADPQLTNIWNQVLDVTSFFFLIILVSLFLKYMLNALEPWRYSSL